ncbi:MAG: FAD-dependent oxidoreductase [bacterium]|nr:FAD-dependent oxidoreductase [bacterium]
MKKNPVVVILGGGYAGIRAALDVLRKTRADVILVDEKTYHALPTQFYELASVYQEEPALETLEQKKKRFHNLLESVAIPFKTIFGDSNRIEFVQGSVRVVRPDENGVLLRDGRKIDFDYLVVAIGSRTNYFDIPHLKENSIGLKSPEEALNIRNRIDELFRNSPKHKKITVVIGGGGVTGCEFAGEAVSYMKKLAELHQHPIANWCCLLIESGDSILGNASLWVQKKARARLSKRGVTVLTKSPIKDVWPGLLHLGDEKKAVHFDLLVWTAGVKGKCEGEILEHTKLSAKSCIPVGKNLCIPPCDNVFVVGDVAATFDPKTGKPTPMTAQKAVHDGTYAAYAIARRIKNKKAKLKPYVHKRSDYIFPLGGKYALLQTRWLHAKGFKIWLLKYFVLFRYVRTILPTHKALLFVIKGVRLFTKND